MDNTKEAELERLKKDCLLTEQRWQDEKKSLSNVIYALGRVVALHEALMEEYEPLKKMVASEQELPLVEIENQVEKLKSKIFTQETKEVFDDRNKLDKLNDSLLKSCRIIKRIVVALVDDFYPTTGELKAKADAIDINCPEETAEMGRRARAIASRFFSTQTYVEGYDRLFTIAKNLIVMANYNTD